MVEQVSLRAWSLLVLRHEYHQITGKEGQAPLSADEFAGLPEIRRLAELCAKCGLDQECLSLQEIAVYGESEHQFPC